MRYFWTHQSRVDFFIVCCLWESFLLCHTSKIKTLIDIFRAKLSFYSSISWYFFVCILQSPMWQKGAKSYHCGWVNNNKSRKVVFSQKKALVDESSFAKPCEECSRGCKFKISHDPTFFYYYEWKKLQICQFLIKVHFLFLFLLFFCVTINRFFFLHKI